MTNTAAVKPKKNSTWAWALWDWAEQPYPTIMQTFIFPVYLAGAVATAAQNADVALGWATAISGVILALIAPVLGRRSDINGRRKFWLMVNTYILVVIMVASFFVEPKAEFFLFGLVLYGLGSIIQESAFINYYAMLKQVSNVSNIGKISGFAWGLGYLGGIILLMFSLVAFVLPDVPWFGIPLDDSLNIRSIFLFSAVWTLVFSIPLMLFVPEIAKRAGAPKETLAQSYVNTLRDLSVLRRQAFGFDQTSIIFFGIAANVVSGLGAVIGGILDDRIGSRAVILGSLVGLIISGSAVFIFADQGPITYWVFGLALCLFVGPAQASSRTFVSRFTPAGREGEVFGLYQLTGRAISFLSGTLWALSIMAAEAGGVDKDNSTVYGIWGLIAIIAVGFVLLTRVHPRPSVID